MSSSINTANVSGKKRSQILPPGANHRCKVKVAGRLGQRFLEKIQNGGRRFTRDWLACLGWKRSFNNFIAHYIFWFWLRTKLFSNAGYQNCSKMIRDLTFVVQFAYFSIRPKKGFRILEQLLSKFHPKKQLLIVFWVTFEQLFEKFRETFWKISSNLWEAPLIPSVHVLSGYSYVSLKFGCCSHSLNFGIVIRFWETAHLPLP